MSWPAVGEGILSALGGVSTLRFVGRRISWWRDNRSMIMKLKSSHRSYNGGFLATFGRHEGPKAGAPDYSRYTIPDPPAPGRQP